MSSLYSVTTFYKFVPLAREGLSELQARLQEEGNRLGIIGLILVAPEGINGTIAGPAEGVAAYKEELIQIAGALTFKDSPAERSPFKRLKIRIKEEIVDMGKPELSPPSNVNNHLSPTEWKRVLEEEDVVLVDARNTYETRIGAFKGAIDPHTQTFNQFPEFVAQAGIPKDKKVLLYCTGGIRCEKAILNFQKAGYGNVFQLQGGILQYLKEYPDTHFEGECFVFDHRVAVDQQLRPSALYKLCPHCGNAGEIAVVCEVCAKQTAMCPGCKVKGYADVCSKACKAQHAKISVA